MPQAPPAVSEVTLATLDVPSGAARARAPDASKAQSGRAEGAPSGGLLVPQTAAAALSMPASPVGVANAPGQRLAEAAAPVASSPLVPVAVSRPSVPAGAANLAAIATDAARAGAVRPDTIAGASAVPDMPTQPAAQPQPAARPLAPAATLPEARAGVPTRMTVTASAAPLHEAAARAAPADAAQDIARASDPGSAPSAVAAPATFKTQGTAAAAPPASTAQIDLPGLPAEPPRADALDLAPDTRVAAQQSALPSAHLGAALDWSLAGLFDLDAAGLNAVQAFLAPDTAREQRDGIAALLDSPDCARLFTLFDPDTGALELRGHGSRRPGA